MKPETKAKKLEGYLDDLEMMVTKDDFTEAFEQVVKLVENLKKTNSSEFDAMQETVKALSAKLKEANGIDLENVKKECRKVLDGVMREHEKEMNYIYDKVRKIKEGIDGKDGKDGVDGQNGAQGPAGKDAPIKTPQETRDDLETLEGDERLDKSAIKGIEQIEEQVKAIELRPARGVGGAKGIGLYVDGAKKLLTAQTINLIAGTGITISYAFTSGRNDITISATGSASLTPITVTGTIDDSNTSFTAASTPNIVIVNGAAYRDGAGCTIAGTAITLNNPVGTGGDIYCL